MSEITSREADKAFGAYQVGKSDANLIAWFRAELVCDVAALRQHGHHDDDILRNHRTMVVALVRLLYEMRTGQPLPKSVIVLAAAA